MRSRPRWSVLALVVLLSSACGQQVATAPPTAAVEVHLGFFPNLTHATALYGMAKGLFAAKLAERNATLKATVFNAGPDAVEALFAGALDATYIGPGPTLNAFARSHGEAVRVVSGATSGGAFLVVRAGIDSAADLRGTRLATPQLGNTQDIALRAWLADQGYHTDLQGTGDVSILPQSNAQTVEALRAGEIDGAWIPEPYATQAIATAGVHVLVDERDLWPDGRYVTTQLIVRTAFLKEHPEAVRALLEAQVEANDAVNGDPAAAQQVIAGQLKSISGSDIDPTILATAWGHLVFTNDPIASSLLTSAQRAHQLGLLDEVSLDGLYDLNLLNQVLAAAGESPVPQP